jgi:hypothetical protein
MAVPARSTSRHRYEKGRARMAVSKRQTTMAKLAREQAVRERRKRKQQKRDDKKQAAAALGSGAESMLSAQAVNDGAPEVKSQEVV